MDAHPCKAQNGSEKNNWRNGVDWADPISKKSRRNAPERRHGIQNGKDVKIEPIFGVVERKVEVAGEVEDGKVQADK